MFHPTHGSGMFVGADSWIVFASLLCAQMHKSHAFQLVPDKRLVVDYPPVTRDRSRDKRHRALYGLCGSQRSKWSMAARCFQHSFVNIEGYSYSVSSWNLAVVLNQTCKVLYVPQKCHSAIGYSMLSSFSNCRHRLAVPDQSLRLVLWHVLLHPSVPQTSCEAIPMIVLDIDSSRHPPGNLEWYGRHAACVRCHQNEVVWGLWGQMVLTSFGAGSRCSETHRKRLLVRKRMSYHSHFPMLSFCWLENGY